MTVQEQPTSRLTSLRRRLALLLILLLAAHLRFTGLSWELRHKPHSDERPFVGNVGRMIATGSLDHQYYEYPGLLFYLLYPTQALASPGDPAGPDAYLAARGLVAAFGVASVGAAYQLGARMLGTRAGLVAALLLAVAPLEVKIAHRVRPDVVLETFALLALAWLQRLGSLRREIGAGALLGAACAVKLTGALLVPAYLVARVLAPGPHLRRALIAGGVCILVFLAFTPYALIHAGEFLKGVQYQLGAHYRGREAVASPVAGVGFFLSVALEALGPVGAGLALAGLVLALRSWRAWAPPLVFVALYLGVMSTSEMRFPRFVLPVLGVLCVLAAQAVEALARRTAVGAALLTAVALVIPLRESSLQVKTFATPSDWDRTLDWIQENVPGGATILDTGPGARLGFDHRRVEVLRVDPPTVELAQILASEVDLVLMGPGGGARWGRGLERSFALGSIQLRRVPEARRVQYDPVTLRPEDLSAVENGPLLGALCDGDTKTIWRTVGDWKAGDWIAMRFAPARNVGRIELILGSRPDSRQFAAGLRVFTTAEGGEWRRVPAVQARPPLDHQVLAFRGASQVLLVVPQLISGLRIEHGEHGTVRWELAEIAISCTPLSQRLSPLSDE